MEGLAVLAMAFEESEVLLILSRVCLLLARTLPEGSRVRSALSRWAKELADSADPRPRLRRVV